MHGRELRNRDAENVDPLGRLPPYKPNIPWKRMRQIDTSHEQYMRHESSRIYHPEMEEDVNNVTLHKTVAPNEERGTMANEWRHEEVEGTLGLKETAETTNHQTMDVEDAPNAFNQAVATLEDGQPTTIATEDDITKLG